jgi:hypothetical protein
MNIFIKTNKVYLLFLFLLALGLLTACSGPAGVANSPQEPPIPPDRVDVVYFYSGEECRCQEVVGNNIKGTLIMYFNGELTSGKLTFQSLDLDDNENATTAYKYGATPESLFINTVRADTEHIISVSEISLVKDDPIRLDNLVSTRIQKALDGEE